MFVVGIDSHKDTRLIAFQWGLTVLSRSQLGFPAYRGDRSKWTVASEGRRNTLGWKYRLG